MRLLRSAHRDEHGSMAVTMMAAMVMLVLAGFLVIDVGVWYGDRREAQTSADLAALAGAQRLPSFTDNEGASAAAYDDAIAWAEANDVDPSTVFVEIVNDCFSASDAINTGVRVSIQREADSMFLGFFSDLIPTVGAKAEACTGMGISMIGFMPWALELTGPCFQDDPLDPSFREPRYGKLCNIVVGGSGSEAGSFGQLGFDAASDDCGAGDSAAESYEENVINGVDRYCSAGDGVTSNPGVNVGKTLSGLKTRLSTEGFCDAAAASFFGEVEANTANFNADPSLEDLPAPDSGTFDDFFEVWAPNDDYDLGSPAENLTALDCDLGSEGMQTSPRNIIVVLIEDIGTSDGTGCTGGAAGAKCYEVQGFGRMYLEGCTTDAHGFRAKCDQGGAGGTFTIQARFVDTVFTTHYKVGLNRYGDIQTFLKE